MKTEHTISLAPPLADSAAVLSVEDRIAALEAKVLELEAEKTRFMNALQYAGKFIFENPASKMLLMSLPKEMKTKLQAWFSGVKS
jgi:hypothetical protein